MMKRFRRTIGISDDDWSWLQIASGLDNPAVYAREIISKARREHEVQEAAKWDALRERMRQEQGMNGAKQSTDVPSTLWEQASRAVAAEPPTQQQPSGRREEFDKRWAALDCDDEFDDILALAKESFIKEQGIRLPSSSHDEMEDKALRYLENAVAKRGMENPRGWLVKRYQRLQTKPPRRTYAQ